VVGGGDLLAQYQAQVEKRQIQARVNFAGAVTDEKLSSFYQNADLLVLPSLNAHEAFGLVLVEAMASGIPVVASTLPGVRSVFIEIGKRLRETQRRWPPK
ncbi:MAG: glycosyltransferase, partial [Candidatus Falkowbacteria bacterium]|nr:glycosyltransferase [Candidatus Falkowbacteria bacterium]